MTIIFYVQPASWNIWYYCCCICVISNVNVSFFSSASRVIVCRFVSSRCSEINVRIRSSHRPFFVVLMILCMYDNILQNSAGITCFVIWYVLYTQQCQHHPVHIVHTCWILLINKLFCCHLLLHWCTAAVTCIRRQTNGLQIPKIWWVVTHAWWYHTYHHTYIYVT